MTPRERQLATIRHEATDRISVDAIGIENVPQVAQYLHIPEEAVLDRLGLDGRQVAAWTYLGEKPPAEAGAAVSEWGTAAWDDYGLAHHYPLASAATVADIEGYRWWPDAARYNYDEAAVLARQSAGRYATRGPYWKPIFCQVCGLMGMEEAMVKMATEPAMFQAAVQKVSDHVYEYSRRLLDACGDALDIYSLGDDFATQRGLMISPDQWRTHLKPHYARLFAQAKARGKPVWFHSCGDITSVLPDLIDIGMDVWETVQLHALPISAEALKREYGKYITFFGGVNTQRLPFATPDEVRAEVTHCIRVLGEGGGYICGPDHHIKPDVPPANVVALFDAATSIPHHTGASANGLLYSLPL